MINSLNTTELQKVSIVNSMKVILINNNYKYILCKQELRLCVQKLSCPIYKKNTTVCKNIFSKFQHSKYERKL